MTDAKKRSDEIVRSVLTPVDWSPHAMFLIDGQWYESKWGCDTMDHLRDAIQAELERKYRWTPIEEAAGWDGDMKVVYAQKVCDHDPIRFRDPFALDVIRKFATDFVDSRFYVYPAPPEFNPEDYGVKP